MAMMRRTVFPIALVVAGGVGLAVAVRPARVPVAQTSSPSEAPGALSQAPRLEDVERRLGPFPVGPFNVQGLRLGLGYHVLLVGLPISLSLWFFARRQAAKPE